jgi:hypothetical protein
VAAGAEGPTVNPGSPTELVTGSIEQTETGFEMTGKLNPDGLPTTYHYEYLGNNEVECFGTENCWRATAQGGPVDGETQQKAPPIKVTGGLIAGVAYRYRLVATNADGTVYGGEREYTVPEGIRVNRLEPSSGPTSGGTRTTIVGDHLENMRYGAVYFGSVRGRIVEEECGGFCEIVPYRTLVVESPPHGAGTVDVTVENEAGFVSATNPGDQFTYVSSQGGPPTEVITEPAESTARGFKLKGKLNPGGLPTTYWFIYKDGGVECEDYLGCGPETAHVGPITGTSRQEVPPIEVTGLQPGRTYAYWLIAQNAEGVRRGRELSFTVNPTGAPSEVVTEPVEATASGFRLTGKLNPDGLPTTYYYEYLGSNEVECLGVENCWRSTAHVGPIGGDAQQEVPGIEVTGLTDGVTYRYRLVAINADGVVDGDVVSFTVPVTVVPSGSGQSKQAPTPEPPLPSVPSGLIVVSPWVKAAPKTRPLTRAQKLADALKVCGHEPKKRRASCERQARVKYAKSTKAGKLVRHAFR